MVAMNLEQMETVLSTTIQYPIIVDERLIKTFILELSRWQKFKVYIENLAEKSGIAYPFQKVRRSVIGPADYILFVDGTIICHPSVYYRLQRLSKYYNRKRLEE